MGFGDNEPPAIRAEPFPATLASRGGFGILVLTFVAWDVIKFSATASDGVTRTIEVDSGRLSTDFTYGPTSSNVDFRLTAQGCARALDGSTGFCSPPATITVRSAENTNRLTLFLRASGIPLPGRVAIGSLLSEEAFPLRLRAIMGLD